MAIYADLELVLRRRDDATFAAALRYQAPRSDATQDLVEDGAAQFQPDLAGLRKLEERRDWRGYGDSLRNSLLHGRTGEAFRQARADARSHDAVLRVRLVIERGAVDLYNLHWETMTDPECEAPLFASNQIAFSRFLSSTDWRPVRSKERQDALRALVVISSPSGVEEYSELPLHAIPIEGEGGELHRIRTALGTITTDALVSPGRSNITEVFEKLHHPSYDILYLLCHGTLVESERRGMEAKLFLEDEETGNVKAVSGMELVRRLQDLPERPTLVVLASCQSGGSIGGCAVAAALGPQLARAGVPAVVAMGGEITIETASRFMKKFFEELQQDGQIDRAMSAARLAVVDRDDFWMPITYLRLRSGKLWHDTAAFPTIVEPARSPAFTAPKMRPQTRRAMITTGCAAVTAALWFTYRYATNPTAGPTSLALLPFSPSAQDLAYLAEGLSEELIEQLSDIAGLRVKAFSAVMRYMGKFTDPVAVGQKLGVDAVLVGKVSQNYEDIVVSAELFSVNGNVHLWGKRFSASKDRLPTLSAQIGSHLRSRMGWSRRHNERRLDRHQVNPEAYRIYLQGRHLLYRRRSIEAQRQSIEVFKDAIRIDPEFPLPYTGLADGYTTLSGGTLLPAEAIPLARRNILKALELDPQLADAHSSLGNLEMYHEWDWGGANRSFLRALEIDPDNIIARLRYGYYLAFMGQIDAALGELAKAHAIDPTDVNTAHITAAVLMFGRQYEAGLKTCIRAADLNPDFLPIRINLAGMHSFLGNHDDAIRVMADYVERQPADSGAIAELSRIYGRAGKPEKAQQALENLKRLGLQRPVSPYFLALANLGIGKQERALDLLTQAHGARYWMMVHLKVDPRWDPLRADPRFQDLLRKLRF